MFAALIRADDDVMPLAATLSVLVEGAAAGLIGHAVIIASESAGAGEIGRLADATGADLVLATHDVAADWRRAAEKARGDWLLLMKAGEMPAANWVQALERHALTSRGRPGLLPRSSWRGVVDRALPPARAGAGFVIARGQLLAGAAGRPLMVAATRGT